MASSRITKTVWPGRYRHVLALFLITVLVAVAGYGYIRQQKRFIMEEKRSELTTIADLKTSQIVQWRKERLVEATSIHANAMMSHRIKDYLNGREQVRALGEFRAWMTSLRDNAGYSRVRLFKPNGELIISVADDNRPSGPHYLALIEQAVRKHGVIFSDFHRDDPTGAIDIDLIIPIMSGNRCLAVLVLDIDPHTFLYPLIQSWPTPSKTAETLLVERDGDDVLFLNELRFRKQAALTFRRPLSQQDMPAARAVLGQEGIFPGTDYRGVRVLTAIRTIPGSPWAIVAKVDTREILAPLSRRSWYVAATCVILVIAIYLGISLWWTRKKEAFLRKEYENELRFNSELKQAELRLQEAHNCLEQRVALRTAELTEANARLEQEVRERKLSEESLRKQSYAVEQSPVAIVITDLTGTIEYVNPKFCEYSGYSSGETIGQNPRILKTEETSPEVHKSLWETIIVGKVWEGEFHNRKKNGELFWERAKILPIKNRDGNTTHYMAFKEDITAQKLLEEQLIQSQRLEAIGQLAGGVAHEVRNPLNAILSITEALFREKEIENNPEYEPYIQHIRAQVNRLAHLMNDLLDLGKSIPASSLHPVALYELCQETIHLWRSSGMSDNKTVVLKSDHDAVTAQVMADGMRLQQVIFNLLENAGHHTPKGSEILLQLVDGTAAASSQGMAVVRVIDAGRGIPADKIARVFSPFYSDRKGGTGLGLALVKHFVENMGGTVYIWNNDPWPGCTAEVWIPLAGEVHT